MSECDDISQSEDLDKAVPFHQLLDVSAGKAKAELAHKGAMSQRQRPSTESLRRAVSSNSSMEANNTGEADSDGNDDDTPKQSPTRNPPNAILIQQQQMLLKSPIRQTHVEQQQDYANLILQPPPALRDQKPVPKEVPSQQLHRQGGVPLPGMSPPSSLGATNIGGQTLADQLKSRLEERRKSKEEIPGNSGGGNFVPDNVASDIQEAVKVANENGK